MLSVIAYQVSIDNFLDPEGNQTTFAILRDLNTTLRSVSHGFRPVIFATAHAPFASHSPPHHPTTPPPHHPALREGFC